MVMGALYGVRKQGLATEKLKLNCRPTEGGIKPINTSYKEPF